MLDKTTFSMEKLQILLSIFSPEFPLCYDLSHDHFILRWILLYYDGNWTPNRAIRKLKKKCQFATTT